MNDDNLQSEAIEAVQDSDSARTSRTFSVILYADAENYSCEEVIASCCEYFSDWAYILHDRDTLEDGSLKKPHYHIVGRLAGPRSPQTVANCIGIPANYVSCKKQYTFKKGVRYLLHLDDPSKAQYTADEMVCSSDFSGYVNPYNDVSQARMIMAKLRGEFITDIDVLAIWALNEGCYSEFRRGYSIWRDLVRINKENFEKERLS